MRINLASIIHNGLTKLTYLSVLAGLVLAFVDPAQPSRGHTPTPASIIARTVQPGSTFV